MAQAWSNMEQGLSDYRMC